MEVRREFDVAIIGGSIAGSALAALLSKAGVSVALFERSKFPRDKVCGEFLSWDALPILDLLGIRSSVDRLAPPRIRICRIPAAGYEFPLPGEALGISRLALDELLFRNAQQEGAQVFEETTVTEIDPTEHTLVATRGESAIPIRCRILIGAWGRWGRFDRELNRPFAVSPADRYFGFKRHFRPRGAALESIDLHSFRHGYLGASPIEGGGVNICGLVHEDRIRHLRGGWETFVEEIRRESEEIDRLFEAHVPVGNHYLSTEPVIFRPKSPFMGDVIFVGDAASQIDPLTGNGMAMALQSAALLFPFIVRALQGESDVAARYQKQHEALFSSRVRWSRATATLLRNPRVLFTAARTVRFPAAGRFLTSRTRAATSDVDTLIELVRGGMNLAKR